MKGDRPRAHTPERTAWVLERIRVGWHAAMAAGAPKHKPLTLAAFVRHCPEPRPCYNDLARLGGWGAALTSALDGHAPLAIPIETTSTHPAVHDLSSQPSGAGYKAVAVAAVDALADHRADREMAAWRTERRELLERLDEAERRAAHHSSLDSDGTPPSIQRRERASGMREATAIVLASDWHVEETVDPTTVNNLNAYDLSIAQHRARRFFDGISWLLDAHASHFRIRDLVLWLGGDLITGTIHEELLESNGLSPLLASRFVRSLVVEGIRMLLVSHPEIERIVIPCSHGNHGRTTQKPRISTGAHNSYEHALYLALADDFRDEPRAQFHVARGELVYVNVYDLRVRFTHGDAVKYAGGVGGITIPINKAVASWDRSIRADLTCMGHWHQLSYGSKCIVNGSLIGPSAYTVRIKAEMEVARQAFALIDSAHGVCQMTPIWLDGRDVLPMDPRGSAAIRERLAS